MRHGLVHASSSLNGIHNAWEFRLKVERGGSAVFSDGKYAGVRVGALVVCLIGAPFEGNAQSPAKIGQAGKAPTGVLSLVAENDFFASAGDEDFTNGVLISYVGKPRALSGLSAFLSDTLVNPNGAATVRRGFALGHSLFTPDDVDTTDPVFNERPYAGRLFGEFSLAVEQTDRLDRFAVEAGIIGPAALGDELQNAYHDLIGARDINGWDNQIGNDFGVNIAYEQIRRAVHIGNDDGLALDVIPSAGVELGTIRTNARAGVQFRVGSRLKNDFGLQRIQPGVGGPGYYLPSTGLDWNVFVGLQGRAVAYDVTLDGRLFRDDIVTVDSRALVGDIQTGLAVRIGHVQFAYTYVVRTREFDEQPGAQEFSGLNVSVAF